MVILGFNHDFLLITHFNRNNMAESTIIFWHIKKLKLFQKTTL